MMTRVITQPCLGCKDQSCAPVCPADCIHPGIVEQNGQSYDQLFIDPEQCIDCGLCEPECPVDAIFADDEVPEIWTHFVQLNADFYQQEKDRRFANKHA